MKVTATIALALVSTAIVVPSATAGAPPDAFERAVSRHLATTQPSNYLERADKHYSALQARLEDPNRLDPAIARAIAARQSVSSLADGRSPDTLDSAAQAHAPSPADGRSPDTRDAGLQVQSQVQPIALGTGFDWGDFGIGAGSMLGAVLLVGCFRVATRVIRSKRAQPAAA